MQPRPDSQDSQNASGARPQMPGFRPSIRPSTLPQGSSTLPLGFRPSMRPQMPHQQQPATQPSTEQPAQNKRPSFISSSTRPILNHPQQTTPTPRPFSPSSANSLYNSTPSPAQSTASRPIMPNTNQPTILPQRQNSMVEASAIPRRAYPSFDSTANLQPSGQYPHQTAPQYQQPGVSPGYQYQQQPVSSTGYHQQQQPVISPGYQQQPQAVNSSAYQQLLQPVINPGYPQQQQPVSSPGYQQPQRPGISLGYQPGPYQGQNAGIQQPVPQQFQNGQPFQQPIMNSGGVPYQPINSGFQQPNLQAGFQNMNLGQPNLPVGVNLMAGPPNPESFHTPVPRQDLTSISVSQSPISNAPLEYKRCTLNAIPNKDDLEEKCKLPFGLLITPFRHLHPGESEIPIIQSPQIVRCRRCRAYINPWVQFVEQGSRWKCSMCYLNNDVPSFFDWDGDNRVRVDRLQRPELTNGVVEYIAPQEYMVRPPQPVVMVFVIDVSIGAVQSGMLATGCKSILDSLDQIPNDDDRTKVAFITFDSSLHFYNLSATNLEPQMAVVADLSEVFLPAPADLLVSLSECRAGIESLLVKLPAMFGNSNQTLSAMGKALKFAEKLIGSIGGKIICLQHALPNHDEGVLKMREDPKLRGTPKESQLLSAATTFYKNFAVDCSPSQISIDLFLFNPQYQDVATLSGCVKFTGGALYYYQGFNAARHEDAIKFGTELSHLLTRPLGLESVLRVRAPKGIRMNCFHGNFFLRSTDLLSLPNVNPDNSYAVECMLTEELKVPNVCFQTALLYTSSSGERRIRVLTLCVPVTSSLSEIYLHADHHAIAALLVKKAIDRSLNSKIEDAREALNYKLAEILAIYRSAFNQQTHPQQLMISENLKLLPVYVLGMLKNLCFKDSTSIPTDVRSYMLSLHYTLCPEVTTVSLYPRFFSLSSFLENETIGTQVEGVTKFPPVMNLSSEKLDRQQIFILENGLEIFFWIGREVSHETLLNLFGQATQDAIQTGKSTLPNLDNNLSIRVRNFIASIRETRLRQATIYLPVYFIREEGDKALRMWFLSHLVEDRIENALSYPQFLATVREELKKIK